MPRGLEQLADGDGALLPAAFAAIGPPAPDRGNVFDVSSRDRVERFGFEADGRALLRRDFDLSHGSEVVVLVGVGGEGLPVAISHLAAGEAGVGAGPRGIVAPAGGRARA